MSVAPFPKREEINFTSSGWETRLAMHFSGSTCLVPGAVIFENFVHRVRCQVFVKIVIYLDGGSPTAGADALHFFQRKKLIRRGFLVADAQALFAMGQQLVATAQHATDVGAYLYMILARRGSVHKRVITDHVA